ncbi:carbohydrate-binding domain-containing protein [Patescibacteria group bacterium]|nr:carbohydrate-binding domain-containing protein [Patescibacteria group bacterium]
MKKVRLFLLLGLVSYFVFLTPVEAKVIIDQDMVSIGADEVIQDDLFISGGTITIRGVVEGDVYAAGGTIDIEGEIKGDVVVAGGSLTLSGIVEDDLWVTGGSIRVVSAQVGDSLLAAGGIVEIDEETTVGGSLLLAGGTVSNHASVGRNFFAGGGMVLLNAPVGGEARLAGEQLSIGEKAVIKGDLIYEAQQDFNLSSQATVSGEIREVKLTSETKVVPPQMRQVVGGDWRGARSAFRLWAFVSVLVVGLIFVALFPKPAARIGMTLSQEPFKAMLAGLLTVVLVGPAVLLMFLTVVGAPLGLITLSLLGVYLYLVKIFAALTIGEWLKEAFKNKKMSQYASFSLGLLTYSVVTMVPVIGILARVLAGLVGLGTGYLYLKAGQKKTVKK